MAARQLGAMGERRAAWYYRLRGYRIVARNLRMEGGGEIDLVVQRGRTVVIAEVAGFEAVNKKKREQLIRLADRYLAGLPPDERRELRYDILSLYWTGRRFTVTHFADAFRPIADARRPWLWRA